MPDLIILLRMAQNSKIKISGIKKIFIYLKGTVMEREGEREKQPSICWLSPQMAAMAGA